MTVWGAIAHILASLHAVETRMDALETDKLNPSVTFIAGYKAGHSDGMKATKQKSNYCVGIAWNEYQKSAKERSSERQKAPLVAGPEETTREWGRYGEGV